MIQGAGPQPFGYAPDRFDRVLYQLQQLLCRLFRSARISGQWALAVLLPLQASAETRDVEFDRGEHSTHHVMEFLGDG